jgi:L-threonylcarbamoyladenylate synthase
VTFVGTSDDAVDALRSGKVVAFATDTVYGIAADPTRRGADGKLSRAKGRESGVPLQVLVSGIDQALQIGMWSDSALTAARALWPGAVTIIVQRRQGVELHIGGDGKTIGIRWPDHGLAVELCERCGPLAASSANLHGEPPLTTAAEVAEAFAQSVDVVVDGGICPGNASTVVDLTGDVPVVLREGVVSRSAVEAAFRGGS